MKSVGFLILFVINLFGLSCKGQVYPSSDVKTVIPGSNVTLKWTFRADPSKASLAWFFTGRRVCSNKEELLAGKFRNNLVKIESSSLLPPATLVLKDFDERYDGTEYRFNVQAALVLKDVDERYNGKYRFSVQASVGDGEAEVELYIADKPNITSFTVTPDPVAKEGQYVTITCISKGVPSPDNTIIRNGTKVSTEKTSTEVSTEKTSTTYTIDFVEPGDAGIYTCIAENKVGNDSEILNLTVQVGPTTTPTSTSNDLSTGLIVGIIIASIAVLVMVILIVYCVAKYCCKPKQGGEDNGEQGKLNSENVGQ